LSGDQCCMRRSAEAQADQRMHLQSILKYVMITPGERILLESALESCCARIVARRALHLRIYIPSNT
jgi:hypothetical protein